MLKLLVYRPFDILLTLRYFLSLYLSNFEVFLEFFSAFLTQKQNGGFVNERWMNAWLILLVNYQPRGLIRFDDHAFADNAVTPVSNCIPPHL